MTAAALLLPAALAAFPASAAEATRLCRSGKAALPVVTEWRASERTLSAAQDLANTLGRICGTRFLLKTGSGARGLAVGTTRDFPALAPAKEFDAPEPERREQYLLRSHPGGLLVIGATETAVEDAVADLLWRAGYRRFFPGAAWEVVPSDPDLSLAVDAKQTPSFAARRIWYGMWESDYNREAFATWKRRNRVPGAFQLETGHAYEYIIERNKAAFDAHPEYLGLVGGRRASSKLCLSNPALRRLVAEDAARHLAENPELDSTSVEPSDGEGWCECAACAAMGSVSDRVLFMANEVARALEPKFPDRYAAFYAYNLHAPPPSIRALERVIVTVATAYLPGKLTPEGLFEAWRRQGVRQLGLREYYGIFQWHRSLPGRMRGGDLGYLARTLPRFKALGARFVSAESGEDWGANGLGYYVASRLLWDLSEASRVDALREDFLEKSFGAAKEPMRRFYAFIDGSRGLSGTSVPPSLVSGMYGRLAEAWALNRDPAVAARLEDLILYTRYVELYGAYDSALLGRQAAFDALVRHARRMRPRMMLYLRPLEEWLPGVDGVRLPPDDGAPDFNRGEVVALLERSRGAR